MRQISLDAWTLKELCRTQPPPAAGPLSEHNNLHKSCPELPARTALLYYVIVCREIRDHARARVNAV
jgi:hypothetical protein